MLYISERVGNSQGPEVDVAVDPHEGTNIVAQGLDNAISVLAIANRGNLLLRLSAAWMGNCKAG